MSATVVRAFAPLRTLGFRSTLRAAPRPAAFNAPRTQFNAVRSFSNSSLWQARRFTEQHEWVELAEDNKTATVGITKYAADALGDVIYVELPEVDAEVEAGDTIGVVESVKSASDVMSPVTGVVSEINEALTATPKTINNKPESDGWFAKIKVEGTQEFDALLDEAGYKALVEEEGDH
ncbi:glycine cleavage system H-protein subunit [Ascosphaera pollenicola]|nr:glycine cleavage system H-protein subunit [Ascosphaera pollenicola]